MKIESFDYKTAANLIRGGEADIIRFVTSAKRDNDLVNDLTTKMVILKQRVENLENCYKILENDYHNILREDE